ncbi:MAG TPA: alpha/beta hydrolase [Nocardioidaceae bacterium]|nr:alpha/beta hydrolase [Nocardioidaceae bacterium]
MPRVRRPRRVVTAALSVVLTASLAGCGLISDEPEALPSPTLSPSPLESPTAAAPEPEDGLSRYYAQDVEWSECRDDLECATIRVPLDYARPDGEIIELSLLRVPTENEKRRVGSLVVNPGGPGASGVDYASMAGMQFGAELREAFDIVGFDPRGVGESTPVECLDDDELDEFVAADPDPDTAAEARTADRLIREFGQGCVDRSGDLAAHVSTVEVARDLDVIRAVLGDRRLSYFGASYGTLLGATYAELFPERVGRLVLDGAIDPTLSNEETSLVQARGFETALRAYVAACVDDGGCFLGDSVDAGTRRIRQFLDEVEQNPLPASGDRELTVGHAVLGIWAPLYDDGYWSLLDLALKSAFDGNGAALMTLSDAYTSRGPGGYSDNSVEALYAVNCLDGTESVPPEQIRARLPRFEKASPTFGGVFAWGLAGCAGWPVRGEQAPTRLRAEGAAPILVVGTSRDPATPVEWAEALAEQLESGVLVRRDGDGHTAYNKGNDCVDDTVESYLVSGTVPRSDVDC